MVFEVTRNYKWREGFNQPVKAEIVGQVFEEIEKKKGVVTKELFLEASRPEDSPTHKMFIWDDAIAAEKYRLSISQRIITQLDVEIITETKEEKTFVPAFLNNKKDKEGAEYKNVVVTLQNQETRDIVIERLRRDIEALTERYKMIDELADILQEYADRLKKKEDK